MAETFDLRDPDPNIMRRRIGFIGFVLCMDVVLAGLIASHTTSLPLWGELSTLAGCAFIGWIYVDSLVSDMFWRPVGLEVHPEGATLSFMNGTSRRFTWADFGVAFEVRTNHLRLSSTGLRPGSYLWPRYRRWVRSRPKTRLTLAAVESIRSGARGSGLVEAESPWIDLRTNVGTIMRFTGNAPRAAP